MVNNFKFIIFSIAFIFLISLSQALIDENNFNRPSTSLANTFINNTYQNITNAIWGSITGTITGQSDLMAYLNQINSTFNQTLTDNLYTSSQIVNDSCVVKNTNLVQVVNGTLIVGGNSTTNGTIKTTQITDIVGNGIISSNNSEKNNSYYLGDKGNSVSGDERIWIFRSPAMTNTGFGYIRALTDNDGNEMYIGAFQANVRFFSDRNYFTATGLGRSSNNLFRASGTLTYIGGFNFIDIQSTWKPFQNASNSVANGITQTHTIDPSGSNFTTINYSGIFSNIRVPLNYPRGGINNAITLQTSDNYMVRFTERGDMIIGGGKSGTQGNSSWNNDDWTLTFIGSKNVSSIIFNQTTSEWVFNDTLRVNSTGGIISGGNIQIPDYSHGLTLGSSGESIIYYNGSDQICKANVIGNGKTIIQNDLVVEGNIKATQNITGNNLYGGMWFDNDSTGGQAMTIASAGVWYNVTFDTTSDRGQDLNGFNFVNGNSLNCSDNGLYEGSYSISFQTSGINKEYNVAVSNGTDYIHNSETHTTMTTNSDAKTISSPFSLRCSNNLRITLMIREIGSSDNIGIHHAKLFMRRLAN